jgi:hypothetical protein
MLVLRVWWVGLFGEGEEVIAGVFHGGALVVTRAFGEAGGFSVEQGEEVVDSRELMGDLALGGF